LCAGGPVGRRRGDGGSIYLEANPHDQHAFALPPTTANSKPIAAAMAKAELLRTCRCGHESCSSRLARLSLTRKTGEQLADLTKPGQRFLLAKGRTCGRGNQHFAKPWHQAPRESEEGQPGQERHLHFELKLLADVVWWISKRRKINSHLSYFRGTS